MTFRSGNCDRPLISVSVMPSVRYSVSAAAPVVVNGSTAIESMVDADARGHMKYAADASTASMTTAAAAIADVPNRRTLGVFAGALTSVPRAVTARVRAE